MAKKRREIERRCELLDELVESGKFGEAWELISDLDPEEVESIYDLKHMAEVQEKTGHFEEMKKTYLHIFNTTNARHNLKDFIEVLIRIGEMGEAKLYLKEFEKIDGAVVDDFELRYAIAEASGLSLEERIELLEDFKKEEYMESWGKRLAEAYRQAGREEDAKQELADLHLWFGGARILPDEPEKEDTEAKAVVAETSENLAARMEAASEIENAISEHVGEEVSRIVAEGASSKPDSSEPTLDDMLSETGRTQIERLEVETAPKNAGPITLDPSQPYPGNEREQEEEDGDPSAPIVESVGMPKTASGETVSEEQGHHVSFEAKYLNRRGQAETVGEPVKTDDPEKAKRIEQMFAVDENYEEGPADISSRGIRYWTTNDAVAKLRRRDFEPPHFVLAGGEERITMTMTKKLCKELSRLGYNSAKKVVTITGERMNSIRLEDQIDRLVGRCLLVTEAAELTKESVEQLSKAIREFGEEFVVVLSGPFDEIDCFLEIYPELSELLGYKIRMLY